MKINNVELEDIDILDLEVAERYEEALGNLEGIENRLVGLSISQSIRLECEAIFELFNTMFGEGTDKLIFGEKVNLMTCLKAFDELVNKMNVKSEEAEKVINKYSPNRAQRRRK